MKQILLFILVFNASLLNGQTSDEQVLRKIYDEALTSRIAYEQLRRLCKEAPGRLSGTDEIYTALDLTAEFLRMAGADTVFYQPVMAPNWKRGEKEVCYIENTDKNNIDLSVCALGYSIGTDSKGISAKVVEVRSFEDLESRDEKELAGKIVFFNQPFDNTVINTFEAYGTPATVRVYGAATAAEKGAVATIIRSATHVLDDYPHTGVMRYKDGVPEIPAVCISTMDANLLSNYLKKNENTSIFLRTTCETLSPKESYNVIGEIRGSAYPEEIILVGGHIDTWFNGEGAHDDGAGCIQSIEVLRIFSALGIQPKRTIRAVMFMDEEMSQTGGKAYARRAGDLKESHLIAIESDRGAFTPLGFTIDAKDEVIKQLQKMKPSFAPYGVHVFKKGYGGVDINPLKEYGVPVVGFLPDWHRYFHYHHAASDVFEEVDFRQLQLGSATIASFVYLIDAHGL